MNVQCPICMSLLESSNDIFSTPCGHVFHFPCLTQWLDNKTNCPQCRARCSRDKIKRLYFNVSNNESIREDSCTLQERVDSLTFQVSLKDKEISNLKLEKLNLAKRNTGLKDHIKDVEGELTANKSVMHALKEQIEYFKRRAAQTDAAEEELSKMKRKLENYRNIEQMVCGAVEDVDDMLKKVKDPTTLTTYISIMKREMNTVNAKRKELRAKVKEIQDDCQSKIKEKNNEIKEFKTQVDDLQEQLVLSLSKIDLLEKKYSNKDNEEQPEVNEKENLKDNVSSRKRDNVALFNTNESEEIPSKKSKQVQDSRLSVDSVIELSDFDFDDLMLDAPPRVEEKSAKKPGNDENSPYLLTKSKNILPKQKTTMRGALTFSKNKNALASTNKSEKKISLTQELAYDGFGGHSKSEAFPKANSLKLKRTVSDLSKNKKIKLDSNNKKPMDSFVINLT